MGNLGVFSGLGALRLGLFLSLFGLLSSCGQKVDQNLIIKLAPNESIVLDSLDAYSCLQIDAGIRTIDGFVDPAVKAPVVLFNKMTMQWKKNTKLFIYSAKIKFKGSGIQGGEAVCDLTGELPSLFETAAAANSAIYSAGTFSASGTITSNPKCRVACTLPLADPNVPEISATGEVIVKGSELTNEGTEAERYYRVKSNFRIRISP